MSKPKLYLFAIGGTGSRVLTSLTMLLSSGLKVNAEVIVPMIIDTDVNNGDVEKCRNVIKNYNNIHNALYQNVGENEDEGHFFRTKILPPKELNISGTSYGTLREMINYNTLASTGFSKTKGLFDLLYNEQNKDMQLEKGFLGNPNVGSVVLKNVVETKQFKEFTQDFKQEDRIFVISSIFGGTGAAGFPLLLNVFRDEESKLNNSNYINNAVIGGVSVLPYFQVDVDKFNSGESAINSSTFITKSKAALSYYNRNLKSLVNALYYVGDTRQSSYENFDGGLEQKNPANFIELTAAKSVLEFLNFEPKAKTKDDLSQTSTFFEYGVEEDTNLLNLKHLKKDEYIKQFIKYHYYNLYVSSYMDEAFKNDKLAWRNELNLPSNYEKQPFIQNIKNFTNIYYYKWLLELGLERHNRKYLPFDLSIIQNQSELIKDIQGSMPAKIVVDEKKMFTVVNNIPANDSSSWLKKDKFKYDEIFSEGVKAILDKQLNSKERELNMMFNVGLEDIIERRFSNI